MILLVLCSPLLSHIAPAGMRAVSSISWPLLHWTPVWHKGTDDRTIELGPLRYLVLIKSFLWYIVVSLPLATFSCHLSSRERLTWWAGLLAYIECITALSQCICLSPLAGISHTMMDRMTPLLIEPPKPEKSETYLNIMFYDLSHMCIRIIYTAMILLKFVFHLL
jgi:hypothetical protein